MVAAGEMLLVEVALSANPPNWRMWRRSSGAKRWSDEGGKRRREAISPRPVHLIYMYAYSTINPTSCIHGNLRQLRKHTAVDTLDKRARPELRLGHAADARRSLVIHVLHK